MEHLPAVHRVQGFAPQAPEQIPSSESLQLPAQKGHRKQGTVTAGSRAGWPSTRAYIEADSPSSVYGLNTHDPVNMQLKSLASVRKKQSSVIQPPKDSRIEFVGVRVLICLENGWPACSVEGQGASVSGFADYFSCECSAPPPVV